MMFGLLYGPDQSLSCILLLESHVFINNGPCLIKVNVSVNFNSPSTLIVMFSSKEMTSFISNGCDALSHDDFEI